MLRSILTTPLRSLTAASPCRLRSLSTEAQNLTRQHSTRQKDPYGTDDRDHTKVSTKGEKGFAPRVTVQFSTKNKPGALEEALRVFWKHDINMTRIVSEPSKSNAKDYDFIIDFEGDAKNAQTKALRETLEAQCHNVEFLEPKVVPWFPTSLQDLDHCVQQTLDAGGDLESDHPGFNDVEYRERRQGPFFIFLFFYFFIFIIFLFFYFYF